MAQVVCQSDDEETRSQTAQPSQTIGNHREDKRVMHLLP